jgi:hypothetical protein
VHSWRPAAPKSTTGSIQDGVHLAPPDSQAPVSNEGASVSAEAERPEPASRTTEPRRITSAGVVCAVTFAAALVVLFVVSPTALLSVYVAVPAVLIAGALVYYFRRAQHARPTDFERQPAHGNGQWKR